MTARSDYRVNPITGATSWRTMDQETKTVSQLSNFLPGIYGFRLQDRINTASITVVEAVTGGATWTRVNTSPAAGQYFADTETGLVIFNITDSGKTFYVNYQGGGSIADIGALEDLVSQIYPPGHIYGLTLSNNGTDPTNDINIAAGSARDSTDAVNMDLASAITKRLDAAWAVGTNQGGLDTGAIANTTYHVWLIKRSDTGVVDVLFSTSATSPTMPSGYDYKRRIGAIIRSAGAILAFVQNGRTFRFVTPIADVSATDPGTSAVTRTLTVPTGVVVIAIVIHALESTTGTYSLGILTALDETDTAPSSAFNDTGYLSGNAGYGNVSGAERRIKTNTSSQIRSRVSGSSASVVDRITTIGWEDVI